MNVSVCLCVSACCLVLRRLRRLRQTMRLAHWSVCPWQVAPMTWGSVDLDDSVHRMLSTQHMNYTSNLHQIYCACSKWPWLGPPLAKYCDERVCLSLCVSVCLSVSEHIFGTTRPLFTKFLCMLPMAVARSSSGGVVICYVLPVLWMTSYLLISQRCSTSPPD